MLEFLACEFRYIKTENKIHLALVYTRVDWNTVD